MYKQYKGISMQIAAINSQNNLSHKAYFTNNTNLKRITQYSAHNSFLSEECMNRLKMLPNHELTITSLIKKGDYFLAEVINNNTAKRKEYEVFHSNPLRILVDNIWRDSNLFNLNSYHDVQEFHKTLSMITKQQ